MKRWHLNEAGGGVRWIVALTALAAILGSTQSAWSQAEIAVQRVFVTGFPGNCFDYPGGPINPLPGTNVPHGTTTVSPETTFTTLNTYREFVIFNTGTENMDLDPDPNNRVRISGNDAAAFQVITQPSFPSVAANTIGGTCFHVAYVGSGSGNRHRAIMEIPWSRTPGGGFTTYRVILIGGTAGVVIGGKARYEGTARGVRMKGRGKPRKFADTTLNLTIPLGKGKLHGSFRTGDSGEFTRNIPIFGKIRDSKLRQGGGKTIQTGFWTWRTELVNLGGKATGRCRFITKSDKFGFFTIKGPIQVGSFSGKSGKSGNGFRLNGRITADRF